MTTTKPKHQRIYLVGHGQEMRLVRAAHRAQAINHVARSLINVKVASQDELVHALGMGTTVETATDYETAELPFDADANATPAA